MESVTAYPPNWHIFIDSNIFAIRLLLDAGTHPNDQCDSGVTFFHEAVNTPYDNVEVVKELIRAGADVNFRTHLDFTPLHHAVFYRKRGVFDELIQSGADVNAQDFRGRSILHLAVSTRVFQARSHSFKLEPDTYVIEKLLQHKNIDCNLRDENGDTPLMIAVKDQQMEIVRMLLSYYADPNKCNNNFETPLHSAFAKKLNDIQIYLLRKGASIYIKNKNGETPLDILMKMGYYSRNSILLIIIMKLIALKYFVTRYIKRKFQHIRTLLVLFVLCCDESDHMRCDFISGNLTVHDFILNCFNDNDFKNIILQIHKPLVERLVRNVYSVYFEEIFVLIPKYSLCAILQVNVLSRESKELKRETKNILDILCIAEIVEIISNYLENKEIYNFIVAISE